MGLFRYPDQVAPSPAQAAADFGAYFTAVNPTPGTGLATIAAQATLADTSPFVSIHAPSNGRVVVLDYVRFTMAVIGTGAAGARFAVKTDVGGKANPTGSTIGSLVNVRAAVAQRAATCSVFGGPLVAAAAITPQLLHHAFLRGVAPVVGDSYLVRFGAMSPEPITDLAQAGTAIAAICVDAPPVIVAPGTCAQLHLYFPSQTVASNVEVELGLYEYPQ